MVQEIYMNINREENVDTIIDAGACFLLLVARYYSLAHTDSHIYRHRDTHIVIDRHTHRQTDTVIYRETHT